MRCHRALDQRAATKCAPVPPVSIPKCPQKGSLPVQTQVLKDHITFKFERRPSPNQRSDPSPRTGKCYCSLRSARPFDPNAPETCPDSTITTRVTPKHPESRAISHYLPRPLIDLRLKPHPKRLILRRQRPSHPPTNHFYRLAWAHTRFDPNKEKASASP